MVKYMLLINIYLETIAKEIELPKVNLETMSISQEVKDYTDKILSKYTPFSLRDVSCVDQLYTLAEDFQQNKGAQFANDKEKRKQAAYNCYAYIVKSILPFESYFLKDELHSAIKNFLDMALNQMGIIEL